MRFLLLIIALGLGFWIVKHLLRSRKSATPDKLEKTTAMVRCEHCGLHIPRKDATQQNGQFFCCDEHRKLHQG